MHLNCQCGAEGCKNALWTEENGTYWWVRLTNSDGTDIEKQLFNNVDLARMIQIRDELNNLIKEVAGVE